MENSFEQIKRGKPETITLITEETIEKITKIKLFETQTNDEGLNAYLNNKLYEKHKELLSSSMKKNKSYEVGILWSFASDEPHIKIYGGINCVPLSNYEQARFKLKTGKQNSLVFMHNHPRNTPFSGADISSFSKFKSIYAMTAVCNDGTIHMLRKRWNFNGDALNDFYNKYAKGINGDFTAIKMVAKYAKSLGLTYRCSVTRR